ncbi:hypothetical protein Aple_074400 [Acrocarpospora pleiomorpha]|uniref:Glyoxalase n=1 Tax=Acrocarpospora pleiomorpha TaxID=90975 RepID=A0A5M3XY96_9ACTN|nr:VOC family protein [Acrocarpospora pleiomorpha]GES24541.1 hypothetical protein Aple_074400 [Acrocarpospora pleiomorpha]
MNLLVIYTPRMEECRVFYEALGLSFVSEQHGRGPEHLAAEWPDGMVIELYPATAERLTGALRLGFEVDGSTVALPPGRHLLADPDGRKIDLMVQ